MDVLVFEPKFVGHFLGFAAQAANAFAELGCDVTLTLPILARETTESEIKLRQVRPEVRVAFTVDVPTRYRKWINAGVETAALKIALDRHQPDHVVIPSGDFVLTGLVRAHALRRRLRRIGTDLVLHNVRHIYPDIGTRARLEGIWDQLAISLARGITLHTVDPFVTSDTAAWPAGLIGNPLRHLPHFHDPWSPRPTKAQARHALNLPTDARILGSIGDLGGRKGTELLIRSFAAAPPRDDALLVLFGRLSSSVRSAVAEYPDLLERGRLLYRDQFVSENVFRNFFFAVDSVWAGFPHHKGISSTLLHAADARRPVIASTYGSVAWMTRRYGLGETYAPTLHAMAEAIDRFQHAEAWFPDEEGARRLVTEHSTERFAAHLTADVRHRLERSTTREPTLTH